MMNVLPLFFGRTKLPVNVAHRLEKDGVAGHRLVQRRLQISTGIDSDGRGVRGQSESHRERRREQNVSRPNHWHQ